ncbi:MAG: hypothetical protein ACLFSI_08595 [Halorhodospira sp.]
MERGPSGEYLPRTISGEAIHAFTPYALPPQPPIQMSGGLARLHDRALVASGRLDTITQLLPDTDLFL